MAKALKQGTIRLGPEADPEEEMKNLAALPGFGPWTVQYLAIRALGWPDGFPSTDYGVRKALGGLSAREAQALATRWSPWRSYATIALWDYLQRKAQYSASPVTTAGALRLRGQALSLSDK
jgi:AraC family transcriptional regulator of adaptative response / DNA-3-methyladenine glycosylase II